MPKDKRQGRNLGPYPSIRSLLCAFDDLQLELFRTLLHKSLTLPRAPWTLQLASSGALSSSKTFTEGETGDFRCAPFFAKLQLCRFVLFTKENQHVRPLPPPSNLVCKINIFWFYPQGVKLLDRCVVVCRGARVFLLHTTDPTTFATP